MIDPAPENHETAPKADGAGTGAGKVGGLGEEFAEAGISATEATEAGVAQTPAATIAEREVDASGRSYATGKRKTAISRVWIRSGTGKMSVNGREVAIYFARPVLRLILSQPLVAAKRASELDVMCTVRGGGLSCQAGAIRHGISRALIRFEPALRPLLKKMGFLTRDSRIVERKKYGRRKARRSFQFSKR